MSDLTKVDTTGLITHAEELQEELNKVFYIGTEVHDLYTEYADALGEGTAQQDLVAQAKSLLEGHEAFHASGTAAAQALTAHATNMKIRDEMGLG